MELIQKFIEACRQRDIREVIFLGCEIVAKYGRMLTPEMSNQPEPYMSFAENSQEEMLSRLEDAGQKVERKESIDVVTIFTIVNTVLELIARFRRSR